MITINHKAQSPEEIIYATAGPVKLYVPALVLTKTKTITTKNKSV